MATIPRDIYLKYKNDQTKLGILSNAVQNIDNKIEQLKLYQDNIYKLVLPLLCNVRDHVNSLVNSLDSKSQVGLMELQWKVQDYMKEIQLKLQKISQGFGVQESIVQCVGELSNVLTKMINIYDNMQVYQDHKILADYIANIHSTNSNNIIINNKEFQDYLINLEFTIKSNVIFSQYARAINALTQYIFPFADLYFVDLNLPKHLQFNKDIGSLVLGIIKHIENLHTKLVESKITINKYDPYIHYGNFDSSNQNTGAFFTWKNSEYQGVIAQILAGEEVLVKADITKSNDQYNAIKFNQIGVNFKSANKTMQYELNKQLENFAVSLTHSGNSYYRCNNEIYLIMSDGQIIHYNFSQNGNGEPTNRNLVYDKLKNSHCLLSPYTMWNIKLISTTNKNFDLLDKYRKDVDIELVGYGQYISKEIDICTNTQLDKYYKRCTTESELNHVYNKLNLSNNTLIAEDIYSNIPSGTWYIKKSYDQQSCNIEQQDSNDLTCNYRDSIKNYLLSTSSASSNRPIGYNVVSWIRDNISMFKYLRVNPFEQIKNWFYLGNAKEKVKLGDLNTPYNTVYRSNDLKHSSITPFVTFINRSKKLFKDIISSKLPQMVISTKDNNPSSSLIEVLYHNDTDHIVRDGAANISNHLGISYADNNIDNNIQAIDPVDINGNLIFAQIVVQKMFCDYNKSLNSIHYVSPQKDQNIRINKLVSEILPIINKYFLADYNADNFIANYDSQPQWYKDLIQDYYEEIAKEIKEARKKKKCMPIINQRKYLQIV